MKRFILTILSTTVAGLAAAQPSTFNTNAPPPAAPPAQPATMQPSDADTNAASPGVPAAQAMAANPDATALPTEAPPGEPGTNAPTARITSEYAENGLRINFRGAPLDLVLDYLSEAAGFIINKTTPVQGTVEVWSKQPVTKDEAIELLSSVLNKNGYAVVRNGRILTILRWDTAKTSSQLPVNVGDNPDTVPNSDEVETRIIPVHYASASQLVQNLELLLPTSATITANESANNLIMVATQSDIKRILKIVKALDTSIATVSTIKVRQLQYADAKDTATLITQLFSAQNSGGQFNPAALFGRGGRGGGGPGGGGPGGFIRAAMQAASGGSGGNAAATHVVAVADDHSNSVVISASDDLMATIDLMLDQIDRPVDDEMELKVFQLVNADPGELADQLAQLFPDEESSGNNNQRGRFFFRGPFGGNNNASQTSTRAKRLGKVVAVADPRTASLIVTASRTLMPQISQMINELDKNQGKKEIVSYYELQYADPQDVYQNLLDLFNRGTVRMQNNNNRNSLLGQNNPLTQRETTGNQQGTIGTSIMRSGIGSGSGGSSSFGTMGR